MLALTALLLKTHFLNYYETENTYWSTFHHLLSHPTPSYNYLGTTYVTLEL